MLANMVIGIGADVSGLSKGVDEAEKKVGGLGSRVGAAGKSMMKVGAGMSLAITAPIAGLAKIGIAELDQIEQANTRTAAALARMGGSSLVSIKGVQSLAGELQKLSGQDDQIIQMGQNMLLTFGAIDTSTKAGAAVFAKSSRVMVDFAEATGTSADAAGKMIAKSMASASNGVLLLPRGMKLGAAETAKLTKVMESGASPVAKQAALMEVLGKKVEGSSKLTNAEKWGNLQDQFAGIAAALVNRLMPGVTKLADWLGQLMVKFEGLSPTTQKFLAIGLLIGAMIGPVVMVVGTLAVAFGALSAAAVALNVSMLTLLLVPIAIIAAVALLVAAGVMLYKHWDTVKEKLSAAWDAIKSAVSSAFEWVKGFISRHAVAIALAVTGPIGALVVWMYKNWDTIKSQASTAWGAIKNALATAAGAVVSGITGTIDNVVGAITGIWTSVRTGITTAWTLIKTTAVTWAGNIVNGIEGAINDIIGKVTGVWTSVRTGIATAWGLILGVAKSEAGQVLSGIVGVLNDLPGKLASIGASAGSALVGAIKGAVNSLLSRLRGLSFGGMSFGKGKMKVTVPRVTPFSGIPALASGGLLTGPTMAMMGEYPGANANPEVVAPLDKLQGMLGGGSGVTINITGNRISNDYDVERIGDQLVKRLRLHGISL